MPPQAGDVKSVGRGTVLQDDGYVSGNIPNVGMRWPLRLNRHPSTGPAIPPKHSASALADPGLPGSFRNRIVPTPVSEVKADCGNGRRL